MNNKRTVWLIEWPEDDNMPVRWWNPKSGWMRDANKAVWFARKEDAEALISTSTFCSPVIATEHKFLEDHVGGVGVGWRPWSTAPRDGSRFLAVGGVLDRVETVSWNEEIGCWNCESVTLDDWDHEADGYSRPTLWMPLPPAPDASPEVAEMPKGGES